MVQLTIRCHPVVPVPASELEQWLEQRLNELRAEAPLGIIRMSRLTQAPPGGDCYIGWLVELELPKGEPLLAEDGLDQALGDMRLLGLQPTLLAPTALDGLSSVSSKRAARTNGWTS